MWVKLGISRWRQYLWPNKKSQEETDLCWKVECAIKHPRWREKSMLHQHCWKRRQEKPTWQISEVFRLSKPRLKVTIFWEEELKWVNFVKRKKEMESLRELSVHYYLEQEEESSEANNKMSGEWRAEDLRRASQRPWRKAGRHRLFSKLWN